MSASARNSVVISFVGPAPVNRPNATNPGSVSTGGMSREMPEHVNTERDVSIAAGAVRLDGDLTLPPNPRGLVIFAHGSGSSGKSPRNREVAADLQRGQLATLLFDLLTLEEEAVDRHTAHLRFDIGLLAERLVGATDWARGQAGLARLPFGYFGASTGAA